MKVEEKLKDLIIEQYGSISEFSSKISMPNSTLVSVLKRGIHNSSVTNIIKICKALGISTDELAHDRIVPLHATMQNKSHMTDIEKIVEYTKRNLQDYDNLTIGGKPMSQNEIEMLLDALDIGIGIIKRNRERNEI